MELGKTSTERPAASRAGLFYGWYVAAATGAVAFASWGVAFYQLGVFLNAFHEQRGWSVAALSGGTTLFYLLLGVSTFLAGRAIDRWGPRPVLAFGGVALAAGVFGFGQATALWQVYLFDGLLAAGFGCTSTLALGAVIARWFQRRRAMVITLALSGAPLSALVLVPLSTALLERYGFATTGTVLAAIALAVILPAALLVVRDDPVKHGWQPDGDPTPPAGAPAAPSTPRWTVRAALHSTGWWLLALSFACVMLTQVAFLIHQVNFLSPQVGAGRAATLVGITGACGLLGRLFGGLGDRLAKRKLAAGYFAAQGLAVLLAAHTSEVALLALAGGVVGFTMGNVLALQPLLMAERFGLRSYGAVYGAAALLTQCSGAFGLLLVGVLADRSGGYTLPFTLTGGLGLLAALLVWASGWKMPRHSIRSTSNNQSCPTTHHQR